MDRLVRVYDYLLDAIEDRLLGQFADRYPVCLRLSLHVNLQNSQVAAKERK